MGPAVTALEDALLEGKIRHGMHPVLTWNAASAELVQDPAGNRKIIKGRNPGKRVDGIVAMAMAMSLATGAKIEAKGPSVYETRGIITMGDSTLAESLT
jgi:phage terminase large subunit-like protein